LRHQCGDVGQSHGRARKPGDSPPLDHGSRSEREQGRGQQPQADDGSPAQRDAEMIGRTGTRERSQREIDLERQDQQQGKRAEQQDPAPVNAPLQKPCEPHFPQRKVEQAQRQPEAHPRQRGDCQGAEGAGDRRDESHGEHEQEPLEPGWRAVRELQRTVREIGLGGNAQRHTAGDRKPGGPKTAMSLKPRWAALAAVLVSAATPAQEHRAPAETDATLAPFAWMDGRWRGEATVLTRDGPTTLVQTERSGEMLGGKIRIIEGKGYDVDGAVAFNAFAVIAARPGGGYEMRSWTLDQAGSFEIVPDGEGFAWSIPAGPATIRYEARLEDGKWVEVGRRLVEGQPPVEIFRMELTRVDVGTGWPADGALGPR